MIRAVRLAVAVAILAGCGSEQTETACPDAEARLGRRVCVHRVPDRNTWSAITFPAAAVDQARATTYMVPATSDASLPTLFVDASGFDQPDQSLHFKFLTESFPEFQLLSYDQYLELILDPERRVWYAGSLTEYVAAERDPIFGFTVWDRGDDLATTVTCDQFRAVYHQVADRVAIGAVEVVAAGDLQRQVLEQCEVPWFDPSTALDYELYTAATGCGTLRRYSVADLAAAEAAAEFGWQDLLVTDQAPFDLEPVISGIVTGTRQGELSHLNVRSRARGTPNCYVKGGYDLLADYQGQLVQLTCAADRAELVDITPAQAESCWQAYRPDPVTVVAPDFSFTDLVALPDVPTADAAERRTAVSRFGAKGSNLATLYQRIDPELELDGFVIPVHYYHAFVTANGLDQTIAADLADPTFVSDGAVRRQRLEALRAAIESAPCDPDLVAAIGAEILELYGADDVMVRFRSSSNAEDSLAFTGAGLYDSTSVCLADQTDGDLFGPSHCDPEQLDERDVCRGLTRVWASLWTAKAYEERAWYGIDQSRVAMGILVDTRIANEQANIVAFTGDPVTAGDARYLVNAQIGALDVVSAAPGVWPEKILLTVEDGQVTAIERVRGSTELPEGQWVLDDSTLVALGGHLAGIAGLFPIDDPVSPTAEVLLDTEWKVRADGRLVIKQIRPFLR